MLFEIALALYMSAAVVCDVTHVESTVFFFFFTQSRWDTFIEETVCNCDPSLLECSVIKHRTGNAEFMGSNPVHVWIFQAFNCYDRLSEI